ncbi:MAG: hypothetical protein HC836_22630 [Richelia sp. RM2_1_2]|nr:hypothetical protein [Richelia sp. RM2_1_2]
MRRYHHKVYFGSNVGTMLKEFIENLGSKDIEYTRQAETERLTNKKSEIPTATREILFNSANTLVEFYEILRTDGATS